MWVKKKSEGLPPCRPAGEDLGSRTLHHIHQSASDSTEYDRAGSFNDILEPTFGFSSVCGTTRFGSAKVFPAFRSFPVIVSNAITLLGVRSCHAISSSCAFSRSRFMMKRVAVFLSLS